MRVVVTGGAGFVGTTVVDRLVARGDEVVVVDVVAPSTQRATYVEASVTDAQAMTDHLRDVDAVVHLAGFVRGAMREHPHAGATLQLQGTANVLEACRRNEIPHVGLASSFYVYDGITPSRTVDETTPLDPLTMELFGSAKLMSEALCQQFADRYGLTYTCYRLGPVYGPGGSSAVGDFVEKGLCGQTIDIWGSGQRRNQYTYVDDVADAILAGLGRTDQTYNVVSPERVTIEAVTDLLAEDYGFEATFDQARPEGPSFPTILAERAHQELDWRPTPLRTGIRRTIEVLSARLGVPVPGGPG